MNHPQFNVPSLETMSALLPAFDFTALIASDDFGAVYLANQRSLERHVAIKILAPHFSEDPPFQQLFENTARSMAKLNHPNLIGVFDSGCVERMLYYVMEFVPGKSLESSTQGQPVDFRQAVALIEGICAGLANAHDHQIIHGDIKPSNILLNQKAEPKIGNFGFSHPSDAAPIGKDSSRFIAPEVLAHPGAVSPQSDIFAIGAIFYELITGQPHGPDAAPPSGLSQGGLKVDALWRQATDPDPSQRMADVRAFQAALKKAAAGIRAPISAVSPTPAAGPPITQALPPVHNVGFNWKLVRNLCIIAGLIYAISLAWKNLETTRNRRDQENREVLAQEEAKKELAREEARQRALQNAQHQPVKPSDLDKPVIPEVVVETPEESLARLRSDLASGGRTEMPIGTIQKGDSDYFLVSEAMSWPEAVWFAEKHGGHLAIPSATADLTWLLANLSAGQGIWIGAARSGRNSWALADGTAWKPKKEPTGIGQYLAADKHGFLRAERAEKHHPFIIQWHRDGSNPGALTSVLAAARSTLTQANPVFPPGTRTYGVRHYLFVFRPLTWRDAVDLAENSGGHLIVPSEIAETINLEEMTKDYAAENGIWMGGFLKGDHWLWITGEPWKSAKWAGGADTTTPDSALIIRPGKGWDSQNLTEPASGFIIEWSNDRKSKSGPAIAPEAPGNDIAALTARAKVLLVAADQQRSEELKKNSGSYTWDLDAWLHTLEAGGRDEWGPHINTLTGLVRDNRVPSSIPASSGIQMSEKMAKICEYCAQKQSDIDSKFLVAAEKLRRAFSSKLRETQAQAKQAGQLKLVETIGASIEEAKNLEQWTRSLGVEAKPENPAPVEKKKERDSNSRPSPRTGGGGSSPPLIE